MLWSSIFVTLWAYKIKFFYTFSSFKLFFSLHMVFYNHCMNAVACGYRLYMQILQLPHIILILFDIHADKSIHFSMY